MSAKLLARYDRITAQLRELFVGVTDPQSRMASAAALVHAKLPHHSWTGFYRLEDGELLVGPYQGPLACMHLERNVGVCWASVKRNDAIVVPDVHAFEGHIACDPATRSEVVVGVHGATRLEGVDALCVGPGEAVWVPHVDGPYRIDAEGIAYRVTVGDGDAPSGLGFPPAPRPTATNVVDEYR